MTLDVVTSLRGAYQAVNEALGNIRNEIDAAQHTCKADDFDPNTTPREGCGVDAIGQPLLDGIGGVHELLFAILANHDPHTGKRIQDPATGNRAQRRGNKGRRR